MCQLQGEEGQRYTAAKILSWDPEQAVQLPAGGPASLKLTVKRDCAVPLLTVSSVYSASSTFLPSTVVISEALPSGDLLQPQGRAPLPAQPRPPVLLFPIEEEKHFLLSLFLPLPPPSSALCHRHRGDLQEGVGSIDLGDMLSSKGQLTPAFPNSRLLQARA